MYILRIEHKVPNFEGWKSAFDSDPVGRKKSGVLRYQVCRQVDDQNIVNIDLEFETENQARQLLGELQQLWSKVGGKVMMDPKARIVQRVESIDL